MVSNGEPPCKQARRAWARFIDAFVDFSIGGHVLPQSEQNVLECGNAPTIPAFPGRGPISAHLGSKSSAATPSATQRALQTIHGLSGADDGGSTEAVQESAVPDRIVAVGDLHGDISKTREALQMSGIIDDHDRWIGGSSVLVQVGDVLDRGGGELEILYLLEKLKSEARLAGGRVHTLLGNHETGSADGWLRYASEDGFLDFRRWAAWSRWANGMVASCSTPDNPGEARPDPLAGVPRNTFPSGHQARYAALMPGGPINRRFLWTNPVTLQLGETLFVHGGVLPEHVAYGLDRINRESRDWMGSTPGPDGSPPPAPHFFRTSRAIVWARDYSHHNAAKCDCAKLEQTLQMLPGVKRMVVGHTVQQPGGVNAACDGQVVRVDVGMSWGCGGSRPEVLEILQNGKQMRVLRQNRPPEELQRAPSAGQPQGSPRKNSLKASL